MRARRWQMECRPLPAASAAPSPAPPAFAVAGACDATCANVASTFLLAACTALAWEQAQCAASQSWLVRCLWCWSWSWGALGALQTGHCQSYKPQAFLTGRPLLNWTLSPERWLAGCLTVHGGLEAHSLKANFQGKSGSSAGCICAGSSSFNSKAKAQCPCRQIAGLSGQKRFSPAWSQGRQSLSLRRRVRTRAARAGVRRAAQSRRPSGRTAAGSCR